jgi:hypothetical protein
MLFELEHLAGDHMRIAYLFLFLILISSLAIAQEIEVVKAKFNVAECYINATVASLDAVDECTSKYNVTVTDLSNYRTTLESDRSTLQSASTIYEFDSGWVDAKTHMNETFEAIKETNSTLEGKNASIGLAKLCYAGKTVKNYLEGVGCVVREGFAGFAKVAILAFYDASIQRGDTILFNAQLGGLKTDAMEQALDYAKSLRPELVESLEKKDRQKYKEVSARFGRSVIRFYAEYATSLADWAEPLVKNSNNYNKDEILDKISSIRDKLDTINNKCPADYTVSDQMKYSANNRECWALLKDVERESREVIALHRAGRPVVFGGKGSLHAQGTGNVSIFGSGSVNATGDGDIYFTDFKGDSSVIVDVTGVKQPDGSTKYPGFSNAQITGNLFHVRISGDIDVDAQGKGLVKMQGDGTFSVTPGLDTEGNFSEVN